MPNYRTGGNAGMRRTNWGCNHSYSQGCTQAGNQQQTREKSCEPGERLDDMPIAMAYVPWQRWKCIYEAGKGFHRGTIFEELDLPFLGRGGCNS